MHGTNVYTYFEMSRSVGIIFIPVMFCMWRDERLLLFIFTLDLRERNVFTGCVIYAVFDLTRAMRVFCLLYKVYYIVYGLIRC